MLDAVLDALRWQVVGALDLVDPYFPALDRELARTVREWAPWRPRTIYIGGGTPIRPERLSPGIVLTGCVIMAA